MKGITAGQSKSKGTQTAEITTSREAIAKAKAKRLKQDLYGQGTPGAQQHADDDDSEDDPFNRDLDDYESDSDDPDIPLVDDDDDDDDDDDNDNDDDDDDDQDSIGSNDFFHDELEEQQHDQPTKGASNHTAKSQTLAAAAASGRYVPPHLRRVAATASNETGGADAKKAKQLLDSDGPELEAKRSEARRRVRGLLNRVAEGNIRIIAQQFLDLYRDISRARTFVRSLDQSILPCLHRCSAWTLRGQW